MILATDVHYHDDQTATAAGILFHCWKAADVAFSLCKEIGAVAPYEPGAFYKRELPCILAIHHELSHEIEAIVIDGYVTLGSERKPGLGMHLFESLARPVPVIGVAKKAFTGTPEECKIFRGQSQTPLYVTSVGVPLAEAKAAILHMHGSHRIPTLLKRVDHLCRG